MCVLHGRVGSIGVFGLALHPDVLPPGPFLSALCWVSCCEGQAVKNTRGTVCEAQAVSAVTVTVSRRVEVQAWAPSAEVVTQVRSRSQEQDGAVQRLVRVVLLSAILCPLPRATAD